MLIIFLAAGEGRGCEPQSGAMLALLTWAGAEERVQQLIACSPCAVELCTLQENVSPSLPPQGLSRFLNPKTFLSAGEAGAGKPYSSQHSPTFSNHQPHVVHICAIA